MTVEKQLNEIKYFLAPHLPALAKAGEKILDQEISKYPIFVVSRLDLELGVKLLPANENEGGWSINASTLEEFATKQVIRNDRVENFKSIYKDPKNFFCLFVYDPDSPQFVFLPR